MLEGRRSGLHILHVDSDSCSHVLQSTAAGGDYLITLATLSLAGGYHIVGRKRSYDGQVLAP